MPRNSSHPPSSLCIYHHTRFAPCNSISSQSDLSSPRLQSMPSTLTLFFSFRFTFTLRPYLFLQLPFLLGFSGLLHLSQLLQVIVAGTPWFFHKLHFHPLYPFPTSSSHTVYYVFPPSFASSFLCDTFRPHSKEISICSCSSCICFTKTKSFYWHRLTFLSFSNSQSLPSIFSNSLAPPSTFIQNVHQILPLLPLYWFSQASMISSNCLVKNLYSIPQDL